MKKKCKFWVTFFFKTTERSNFDIMYNYDNFNKKDKSMLNMICHYFCCDVKNGLLGKKNQHKKVAESGIKVLKLLFYTPFCSRVT